MHCRRFDMVRPVRCFSRIATTCVQAPPSHHAPEPASQSILDIPPICSSATCTGPMRAPLDVRPVRSSSPEERSGLWQEWRPSRLPHLPSGCNERAARVRRLKRRAAAAEPTGVQYEMHRHARCALRCASAGVPLSCDPSTKQLVYRLLPNPSIDRCILPPTFC